ncbi:MAG: lysophospholipase, partial [Psychroflexus sp.]|nr:lysophospholipase [Psychroflexus sp.]
TSVFGYSMGGYVALKLAMKYPGKVEKVMTLGTKIQWNAETAEKEVRLLDPKKMREKIPRFVALLKEEHAPGDWKKLVLKTAAMLHGLGNGKAIDLKCFTRLETSVLVCLGSEDTMVSKIESEELVDNLDKGRFLEIQGFKHPIGQVDQSHLSDIMLTYFTEE